MAVKGPLTLSTLMPHSRSPAFMSPAAIMARTADSAASTSAGESRPTTS
eukprot:CAMPEP_0202903066 /NCGR_PEP_ID=MMETSP1392-20130828/20817_1 /ASSEMBLY_ACC=CAM_ASM_000868 /TAXON_ID=225041 /ORGANISM="Chlamydomonas chlamydogama, Strain SAG 11-48b" /LENGTH=48 /DNA_ID=CAMNT_0049590031 /DNA_START=75 /DNA_END=221 /DNA_ORIENTATION=+